MKKLKSTVFDTLIVSGITSDCAVQISAVGRKT